MICLLDYSHPGEYEVVSHCGFDLNFPMIYDAKNLFMCLLGICLRNFIHFKFRLSFYYWVVWVFKSILDAIPLLDIWSENVWKCFLLFCGLSFYFLGGVLWNTHFKILMTSNLFFSFSFCLCFGVISGEMLPNWYHKDLLCFLLGVLEFYLTFRSLMHFELIFIYDMR